ncbi:Uncharacterised protein [Mycobacteroides abscessus]|nr:Uncharacterised protein [Mycobacteroides abscessus]
MPCRTIHSARSVASVNPAGASCAIRSVWNRSVATSPAIAGSSSSNWDTESNRGSLSSCRSRLYANGCAFKVASKPVRLPINLPVLPRASSAISGFFFCGMIELPVDHESSRVTYPNSVVPHKMMSSDSRDKSMPIIAKTKPASAAKSRDDVASIELSAAAVKPRSSAMASGSRPNEEPANAPAP